MQILAWRGNASLRCVRQLVHQPRAVRLFGALVMDVLRSAIGHRLVCIIEYTERTMKLNLLKLITYFNRNGEIVIVSNIDLFINFKFTCLLSN